jgi:hypothetical protein
VLWAVSELGQSVHATRSRGGGESESEMEGRGRVVPDGRVVGSIIARPIMA